MAEVLVPAVRMARWVENFAARHGESVLGSTDGCLTGAAPDGSSFVARLPFGSSYAGPALAVDFAAAAVPPVTWGILLVRKGGFAVARLEGLRIVESKVGRRHVQGRTKAGGQSQQRFARRRDNQARAAYEAAADHAARILAGVELLVTGGDHGAVEAVLSDARLRRVVVVEPWLPVPDPRRAVLEQAVRDAGAIRVAVVNSPD